MKNGTYYIVIFNNRWFYEIDPSDNFENFDIDDFQLFLGALFADGQTFIIRTESMLNNPSEILFAFNYLSGSLLPNKVIIPNNPNPKLIYPTEPGSSLYTSDFDQYMGLYNEWDDIIEYFKDNFLFSVPIRPDKASVWLAECEKAGINNF